MKENTNVLILGHGRTYKPTDIRCIPIPLDEWFEFPYTCVDINPDINPDIVYDLDTKIQWNFASNNEYDVIIDTCGILFSSRYKIRSFFLNQINRILNPNGFFFGRKKFIYCKTDDNIIYKV
jgi:hypothetical protein